MLGEIPDQNQSLPVDSAPWEYMELAIMHLFFLGCHRLLRGSVYAGVHLSREL